MELIPLGEPGQPGMMPAYILHVQQRDSVRPLAEGGVILLRGIEYGVCEPQVHPDGGWSCRLEDLGREEPPWREPIPDVWNLGWVPGRQPGAATIPSVQRGDPRDPQVVAGQIFSEWMDRGTAASWNG